MSDQPALAAAPRPAAPPAVAKLPGKAIGVVGVGKSIAPPPLGGMPSRPVPPPPGGGLGSLGKKPMPAYGLPTGAAGAVRPAGAPVPTGAARPAGAPVRPAGAPVPTGATRPAGAPVRPSGAPVPTGAARPAGAPPVRPSGAPVRPAGAPVPSGTARPAGAPPIIKKAPVASSSDSDSSLSSGSSSSSSSSSGSSSSSSSASSSSSSSSSDSDLDEDALLGLDKPQKKQRAKKSAAVRKRAPRVKAEKKPTRRKHNRFDSGSEAESSSSDDDKDNYTTFVKHNRAYVSDDDSDGDPEDNINFLQVARDRGLVHLRKLGDGSGDIATQMAADQRRKKKVRPKRPAMPKGIPSDFASAMAKAKDALVKHDVKMRMKDDSKEVSLGTSKTNYIDPRVPYAWMKANDVPPSKVFGKTLLDKFGWAAHTPADYRF